MATQTTTRTMTVHQVQNHAHHPQQQQRHYAPPTASSPYTPSPEELHPGPKNRLFLALKSQVDDEVDWALPRLVLASFDRPELFLLDNWVDSVSALREWPERWLEELENEAAYLELLRRGSSPHERQALGAVPEFTRNPATLERATNSLQIMRNASLTIQNLRAISRKPTVGFITRFFELPFDFLLEVAARSPEPVQHMIIIIQQIYSYLPLDPPVFDMVTDTLPRLAMGTRDFGLLTLILPILITTFYVPSFPAPPDGFIQHMLYILALGQPRVLLELVLDLLAAMVPQSQYARIILADPSFSLHLRNLVILLERDGKPTDATWAPAPQFRSRETLNPASPAALALQASARRKAEREADQSKMHMFGGPGVNRETGETAPKLSQLTRNELYRMSEPKRSMAWMHETFVYSSSSQLLQVTFWHAYRDFFSNPATVEQLLSASEVIKNVTVAFPAAQAMALQDDRGENKFVIAGLGFRKESDEGDRFTCHWNGCDQPSGPKNPGELLDHIQARHLSTPHPVCGWGSCGAPGSSLAHLATHLPQAQAPKVPNTVAIDAQTPPNFLTQKVITTRPAPPLPPSELLRFAARMTPHDAQRNPTGISFLSALVIRGLARSLRSEIAAARPEEAGMSDAQRREKKKHLAEDRFGLPIPANVLREEEEEEDEASGEAEVAMGEAAMQRARDAFRAVEERVLEIVGTNLSGVGHYLGDAFGF